MRRLDQLVTEGRNPSTTNIDQLTCVEIVRLINDEDKIVALAVEKELESIAQAADLITAVLKNRGHVFYIGAGTSGRLGVLDASECPPTFGVDPYMFQGVIAGGDLAFRKAIEKAEDNPELARQDLNERGLSAKDIVVGIAASGRTPYVLGALEAAREIGAKTIAISCNPDSPMAQLADIAISPVVGPEVIMGSTRLKAGTAQKMVLNMLSTASMIRLGKVYSNLMVDLKATNQKLTERSKRIVVLATGCSEEKAAEAITACKGSAKQAIVMILANVNPEQAEQMLAEANGFVRVALDKAGEDGYGTTDLT